MKKMMLFVNTLSIGGAERVVSNLTLNLPKKIERKIILFEKQIDYPYDAELEVFAKTPDKKIFRRLFNFMHRYNQIKKIKKENQEACVISFLEQPNLLNVLTKKYGRTIVSVRNYMSLKHQRGFKSYFWNMTIRMLYKNADNIIAASKEIKKDLVNNYKIPKEKIDVIYNSYEIKEIEKLSQENIELEYKKIFDKPVIITVGRLHEQKGHYHLIRAFNKVKKHESEAQLVILGEGRLKKELELFGESLNLSKDIHFLGFKKNPFKYISKARMFVLTSYYEGFPNALAEAMACGIPVISTDCQSGPREILSPEEIDYREIVYTQNINRYGLLTPVCNPNINFHDDSLSMEEEILSNTMLKLLNNQALWNHFSKQSLNRIKEFDIKKIIKEWEKYCS